jgi:methyl coenzyme M reductase gamma subunit
MIRGRTVSLREIAHGRTGDKGDRSNISVIAYRPESYETLVREVTEDRVAALFAHRKPGAVKRYLLPKLAALNFVIDDVLDGGVNNALNLDAHGKSLVFLLLQMSVEIREEKP